MVKSVLKQTVLINVWLLQKSKKQNNENRKTNQTRRKMKKKVLGLALIMMSLTAFSGMAQTSSNTEQTRQENVTAKAMPEKKAVQARSMEKAFEGIDLNSDQKARLKKIADKQKDVCRQMRSKQKAVRLKNDSVGRMERRAAKKAYLEEVKQVVGPEQYVVFLENMYVNGGGSHQKAKAYNMSHNKDGKKMMKAHKTRDDRKDGARKAKKR